MNTLNRIWRILCWNVRGINSPEKWPIVFNKVEESLASILCFQETKKGDVDLKFIRKFVPKRFDQFAYVPSDGASGGLLIIWASNLFTGQIIQHESFGLVVRFTYKLTLDQFTLVSVYGPCDGIARQNFVAWLFSLDFAIDDLWLIIGDFNFYRYSDSRNKPGANLSDIETFNEVISYLGLIELPIKGRKYTWSNMQKEPLLTQLDWFFYLATVDNKISKSSPPSSTSFPPIILLT